MFMTCHEHCNYTETSDTSETWGGPSLLTPPLLAPSPIVGPNRSPERAGSDLKPLLFGDASVQGLQRATSCGGGGGHYALLRRRCAHATPPAGALSQRLACIACPSLPQTLEPSLATRSPRPELSPSPAPPLASPLASPPRRSHPSISCKRLRQAVQEGRGAMVLQHVRLRPLRRLLLGRSDRGGRPRRRRGR